MRRTERSLRIGLWCNWVFVALTAVGWLGIAHFWAPARADLGLEATRVWFSETHHWGTIIGCTLFYIAAGTLTPGWLGCFVGRGRPWAFAGELVAVSSGAARAGVLAPPDLRSRMTRSSP